MPLKSGPTNPKRGAIECICQKDDSTTLHVVLSGLFIPGGVFHGFTPMATTYRHFVANPDSRAVLQTLHRQTAVDIDHLPGCVGHVATGHCGGQFTDVLWQAPAFFDEQFRVVDQVVVFFSDA